MNLFMKTHKLHCQDPWFSLIADGKKSVEGRKNLARFRSWQPGDILVFYCGKRSFKTRITALRRYDLLENYLVAETIERALPGVKTISEGIDVYLQWSTLQEIKALGFLGIEIELLQ